MSVKCECSMRIKLTGDGCRYCNPQYYIEILEEQTADDSQRIAELEGDRDRLNKLNILRGKMICICGEYMKCVATFSNPDRVEELQSEMQKLQPQFAALTKGEE